MRARGDGEARRVGIIDLGSNSARIVVLSSVPGHRFHLEDEIREIVRLREGMTARGLSDAAQERALVTLRLFQRFAASVGVDELIPTATSAVREGANGSAFVARVERELGLALRVLSGEEEARYGVIGALNAVPLAEGLVVDIGGGSAQVSQVREGRFAQGRALTLGALALTERFIRSDPPRRKELKALRAEIERQLDELPWLAPGSGPIVGLGGTIRNLAKVEARRGGYPLPHLNGFILTREGLDETIDFLALNPLARRAQLAGLRADRADIILPGALVLRAILARSGEEALTVSEYGLREGLFFERFWAGQPSPIPATLREFSVRNMARFYQYQEAHAEHVRALSLSLFDQLAAVHGYTNEAREWLDAAALLHDIGTLISYDDHHRYSQMLIVGNGLPGFTPRETAMIALLARYHRKGSPSVAEYAPLLGDEEGRCLLALAPLLRLAEYLERGRSGLVRDVRVRVEEGALHLTLHTRGDPAVELWEAQRNAADLLESSYGRAVTFSVAPS